MERHKSWKKIRDTLPGTFYNAKASVLEKEIRLSKGGLQGKFSNTPFTQIEQASQTLATLDQALDQERILTRRRHKDFSTRWALAYARHSDLDQLLEQFARFHFLSQIKFKEDKDRKSRALEDAKEEEIKLRKLTKELDALGRVKASLEARRNLCERYKDYLVSVVGAYNRWEPVVKGGQPYDQIPDLLERYAELKGIRDRKSKSVLENLDEAGKLLAQASKEKVNFHHEEQSYRMYTQKWVDHKEKLEERVGGLNEAVIRVKKTHHAHILSVERPKTNIYTVYCNLAKEMGQQITLKESNVQGQLGFIQKYLGEMKKISFRVRESLKAGSDVPLTSCMKDIERTSHRSSV